MDKIKAEIEFLETIETPDQIKTWIHQNILGLHKTNLYRSKIKGFHLAFNVRDKMINDPTNYKYKPTGTAKEIQQKAKDLKI